MAVAEGVVPRWRRWLLYSWGAGLLVVFAGMWWRGVIDEAGPPYDAGSILGVSVQVLGAIAAYGVFIAAALTLCLLPAALGTFLWESRWGRHRLDVNGDAIGGAVASACVLLMAILPAIARPASALLAVPFFMATRGFARARADSATGTAPAARAMLLLLAAEAFVIGAQLILRPGAGQILIFVPIVLTAAALGLHGESSLRRAVDMLGLRRPSRRSAWLVALLPALTVVFAQALNPAGFTYADTTLALIAATVAAEIAFRGFAFRLLRRAGARFLVAALIPGMISLAPLVVHARHELAVLLFAGVLAQAVWLAWLVERWQSTWIAIVSAVLLAIGIDSFVMFAPATRVWFTFALRLWIIGMSVALTQTLQRRALSPFT